MTSKQIITASFAVLICCLLAACSQQQIVLEGVRYTPDYFKDNSHWGEGATAMDQTNQYLLETGVIDTTTETPPIPVAFISINNTSIQLAFAGQHVTTDELVENYKGDGYQLSLIRSSKIVEDNGKNNWATIVISNGKLSASYKVMAKNG